MVEDKKTGIESLIEMFQVMDPKERERLLKDVQSKAPQIAEQINSQLFKFEDLAFIQPKEFQLLIRQVPDSILYLALRGASETFMNGLFTTVSERKAKEIAEEIKSRGPQLQSKISAAQDEVMRLAKELEEDGKILLRRIDKSGDLV